MAGDAHRQRRARPAHQGRGVPRFRPQFAQPRALRRPPRGDAPHLRHRLPLHRERMAPLRAHGPPARGLRGARRRGLPVQPGVRARDDGGGRWRRTPCARRSATWSRGTSPGLPAVSSAARWPPRRWPGRSPPARTCGTRRRTARRRTGPPGSCSATWPSAGATWRGPGPPWTGGLGGARAPGRQATGVRPVPGAGSARCGRGGSGPPRRGRSRRCWTASGGRPRRGGPSPGPR